jgi:hypothetical protein
MPPKYGLDKIKFATDAPTFAKAVQQDKPLTAEDKRLATQSACSGRLGTLSQEELSVIKKSITAAMRYIKPYDGPPRIWFSYQNSLSEGCNRLARIVSDLPVSE